MARVCMREGWRRGSGAHGVCMRPARVHMRREGWKEGVACACACPYAARGLEGGGGGGRTHGALCCERRREALDVSCTGARLRPFARRVRFEFAVVGVVREGEADGVWHLVDSVGAVEVAALVHGLVLLRLAPRAVVVPDDQVVPLAARDVVGAVAVGSEVHDGATARVGVGVEVLAVPPLSKAAAKREGRPGELLSEADVECDVRVVVVHVEPQVFALPVLHHEGMVRGERRAFAWEEEPGERKEVSPLQIVDERPHADLVDDDPVVVHAVWPRYGVARGLVVLQLLQEHVAKVDGDHVEAEDAARYFLPKDRADCRVRTVLKCRREALCEPLPAKVPAEERRMQRPVGERLRLLRRARATSTSSLRGRQHNFEGTVRPVRPERVHGVHGFCFHVLRLEACWPTYRDI